MSMFWGSVDGSSPRDISWLDWSRAVAISSDGKRVLFDETGQGGGSRYSVYLYDADKKSSERLGDGRAVDLSGDGAWAITQSASEPQKLFLVSVKDRNATRVAKSRSAIPWQNSSRASARTFYLPEDSRIRRSNSTASIFLVERPCLFRVAFVFAARYSTIRGSSSWAWRVRLS